MSHADGYLYAYLGAHTAINYFWQLTLIMASNDPNSDVNGCSVLQDTEKRTIWFANVCAFYHIGRFPVIVNQFDEIKWLKFIHEAMQMRKNSQLN